MGRRLRRGGGWLLLILFSCREPSPSFKRLDDFFDYKRVITAKAGKDVALEVKGKGDYSIYVVWRRGLFGEEKREEMKREGNTWRFKIDGREMEKGEVIFFWYEVWKNEEKIGTLPDNRGREKLLLEGKIHWKDMIGRIVFK